MRRWLGLVARLYPKRWRARYGVEFACLLEDVEPRWTDVLDVLRGAAMMQGRTWSSYLKLVGSVAVAGAIVAVAVSFLMPGRYVSSAVVQAGRVDDPQTPNRIQRAWQDVTSRRSLSELIQRPNLDLYKGERNRLPLEDLIQDMKRNDLKVEMLKDRDEGAFRVSFVYPDRYKARAVADAVAQKVSDASRAHWATAPANLPDAPIAPNRLAFTIFGLGIGLLAGVVASFFRWRAKWTMKVMGFGLAGFIIAGGLAYLIPNRYTSSATMRVIPAPKADGVERYMQEAEMSAWLQKKEREILSDESLSEMIHRRSLNLYPKEVEDKPLQAVIETMRRDIRVEAPHSRAAFTVSFTYHDRFKAQATVSALVTKFADSEMVVTEADLMAYHAPAPRSINDCTGKTGAAYAACILECSPNCWSSAGFQAADSQAAQRVSGRPAQESLDLLDPASLPETPVAPNRFLLAAAGLFVGLFLGAYAVRAKPAANLRHA